jgi:hypothetical protein
MNDNLVLCVMVAMAIVSIWHLLPRCPECGFLVSIQDTVDPSLRHCQRCRSIYRLEQRR